MPRWAVLRCLSYNSATLKSRASYTLSYLHRCRCPSPKMKTPPLLSHPMQSYSRSSTKKCLLVPPCRDTHSKSKIYCPPRPRHRNDTVRLQTKPKSSCWKSSHRNTNLPPVSSNVIILLYFIASHSFATAILFLQPSLVKQLINVCTLSYTLIFFSLFFYREIMLL